MKQMEAALHDHHASLRDAISSSASGELSSSMRLAAMPDAEGIAFATVNSVEDGSPAHEAVCLTLFLSMCFVLWEPFGS